MMSMPIGQQLDYLASPSVFTATYTSMCFQQRCFSFSISNIVVKFIVDKALNADGHERLATFDHRLTIGISHDTKHGWNTNRKPLSALVDPSATAREREEDEEGGRPG